MKLPRVAGNPPPFGAYIDGCISASLQHLVTVLVERSLLTLTSLVLSVQDIF